MMVGTLKDIVYDLHEGVKLTNETLSKILDAAGGEVKKEGSLLANYPRSGRASIGIGTLTVNTGTGIVRVPGTEVVGHISTPVPNLCRSLLLYVNRDVGLELKAEGRTTISTTIFASWMRFSEIDFDEIIITTDVATKVYLIVSNTRGGAPTLDRLIQRGLDENLTGWSHGHKTVAAAGTAENLDAEEIPGGIYLTVRALIGNIGNIYIGNTKANAEDTAERLTLQPGESSSFKLDDCDLLWLDADNNSEGVEWWY